MTDNCWTYKGKCIKKTPKEFAGFTYRITALVCDAIPKEKWGKIYIGKKLFTHTKKRKLSKKRKIALKTKARTEKVQVDSKWLSYFGSSKELQEDVKLYGENSFKREILHLCYTKAQTNYYEVVEIIRHEVLLPEVNSYNKWMSCRIMKNKFLQNIENQ